MTSLEVKKTIWFHDFLWDFLTSLFCTLFIDFSITLGWLKWFFWWRSLLGFFDTFLLSGVQLLFCFFPPNMRAGIRAAKRNTTFSALTVCFLSMNFLDVRKGIKWYGIRLDRGSLLQVGRPLFLVEIAHDVVVLQWRNWSFLPCRNKSSTSSRWTITEYDPIVLNKTFQFIRIF